MQYKGHLRNSYSCDEFYDFLTGCVTCCVTCPLVIWPVHKLCDLSAVCVWIVLLVSNKWDVPCCQVKPQQLQQPPAPSPSVVSMQSIANPPSPAQMIIAAAQVSQYHPFQFGSAQLLTPAQEPRVSVFRVTSRYVYAVVTWVSACLFHNSFVCSLWTWQNIFYAHLIYRCVVFNFV